MAWIVDAAHSQATFAVRHMMISNVKGRFKVLSGKLNIDELNLADSWVEAQVETASIDTGDANRDNHLRSADFFDAEKYPTITFKSSLIESVGGNEYKVTGELSMHGATKSVIFTAQYLGHGNDPFGNHKAGLEAKTKINRKDWNLTWNAPLESGGVLVSEDVHIEIDLQAIEEK
ncbi:MAG TPA: YceI family protein [Ktedonobacteraceae bacterium]|jgi:polyisoprenoid-binding protein YceI